MSVTDRVQTGSRIAVAANVTQVAAAACILLGAAVRGAHLPFVDLGLPFHFGGLFVEFAGQIAANGFALPQRIPFYSDGGIPFAYPPLPFYLEALLLVLGLPKFTVVTLLPVAVAVLTVPSFYLMVRSFRLPVAVQLASLFAFATLPAAFREQIEGQGLAEATGTLAVIWLGIWLARARSRETAARYALAGVGWALCILASPGSAYASAFTLGIFGIAQLARAGRHGFVRQVVLLALTAVVAAAVSSLYWLPVISNHGIQVFANSFGGQYQGGAWSILAAPIQRLASFLDESGSRNKLVWDAVLLSGMVGALFSRRWGLLAWFLFLFGIRKEGLWLMSVPGAVVAGIGLAEVLGPAALRLARTYLHGSTRTLVAAGFGVLLGLYAVATSLAVVRGMVDDRESQGPSRAAIAVLEWARDHTPADSRLVVVSSDPVEEWAPHIARRTVLNTVYGLEWEPDKADKVGKLRRQVAGCKDFDCIQSRVAEGTGYQDVYLVVDTDQLSKLVVEASKKTNQSSTFELTWQNDALSIGRLSPAP